MDNADLVEFCDNEEKLTGGVRVLLQTLIEWGWKPGEGFGDGLILEKGKKSILFDPEGMVVIYGPY